MSFIHQRHKPPRPLKRPRGLVVAVPEMHSNVNLSRIVRAAGCFGVERVIVAGRAKVDPKIARDSIELVRIEQHRSLPPVLRRYKDEGWTLVALEQTSDSRELFGFPFEHQTILIVGHERLGVEPDILKLVDAVAEIPVYGKPYSFNAATAAILGMYEYCRQFPDG